MFRASKQQKTRIASIFFKVYTIVGAECAECVECAECAECAFYESSKIKTASMKTIFFLLKYFSKDPMMCRIKF